MVDMCILLSHQYLAPMISISPMFKLTTGEGDLSDFDELVFGGIIGETAHSGAQLVV